ncbi:flagellar basal-body rod protein FlgF [bacterium]|nr:flagellar basal-body rod protein FlgF [bacterium]
MDNSLVVGLSLQQVLRQRMDLTANNLANMTTAGFKTERLVMRELSEAPAEANDLPGEIAFVDAWTLQRDFSNGPLERTGNPLDVAIDGEGFFSVQTPQGVAYTRDGRFSIDASGQLVTRSGHPVLGGGPITLNPAGGDIGVSADGTVTQAGAVVGKLDVTAFDTPQRLEQLGDNLWRANAETPRAPVMFRVAAGFVENSNVNAVSEMTQMIEISRAYQSVSQMVSQADELRARAIDRLGKMS